MGAFGYLDKEKLQGVCMAGELGLNGEVKGIRGVLSIIDTAEKNGCSLCIVPKKNLPEAVSAGRIKILGISSLKEFLEHAKEDDWGASELPDCKWRSDQEGYQEDFSEILGQETAKKAAVTAAAGFHNILFIGTKGAGKTMIAFRLPTIFPGLNREESMELSRIYSVAGLLDENRTLIKRRPFRCPHHTITPKALAGGGAYPLPGKSPWHIGVFCFWMNCRNFPEHPWRSCASLWNRERFIFPESTEIMNFLQIFFWPQP